MIARAFGFLLLSALPLAAGGTLDGRIVTLNVETWNDDLLPFFVSEGRTVTVGADVEFDMLPEGRTVGFDVVPVRVEIRPTRIEFSYGEEVGRFLDAPFNGYVLRFAVECALIEGAKIDPAGTTMPVADADIRSDGGALFIDVAGLDYGPKAKLAIDLAVSDCLLG